MKTDKSLPSESLDNDPAVQALALGNSLLTGIRWIRQEGPVEAAVLALFARNRLLSLDPTTARGPVRTAILRLKAAVFDATKGSSLRWDGGAIEPPLKQVQEMLGGGLASGWAAAVQVVEEDRLFTKIRDELSRLRQGADASEADPNPPEVQSKDTAPQADFRNATVMAGEGAESTRPASAARLDKAPDQSGPEQSSFQFIQDQRSGKWHVRYGEESDTFPDIAGFAYIAVLLENSDRAISALVLTGDCGDIATAEKEFKAEPKFDADAIKDYRREVKLLRQQIRELDSEIEEAERQGDRDCASALRDNRQEKQKVVDWVEGELSSTQGKGGKVKEVPMRSTPAEKARQNVRKALDRAIAHLAATMPDLEAHLSKNILTEGTSYAYRPGLSAPVWQVS